MEDELFTEEFSDITWHVFDRDFAIQKIKDIGTEASEMAIKHLEENPRIVLHAERVHMTLSSTEIRENGKG